MFQASKKAPSLCEIPGYATAQDSGKLQLSNTLTEVGVAQNSSQVLQVAQMRNLRCALSVFFQRSRNLGCVLCLFFQRLRNLRCALCLVSALAQFAFANR